MFWTSGLLSRVQGASTRMWTSDWEGRRTRIQRLYIPRLISFLSMPARLVLAVLLILFLMALKPVVQIRFARLRAFTMGLFAIPTEVYLCEVDAGMHPKRALDIFYHYEHEHFSRMMLKPISPKDGVCNKQLDKMFKRNLRVHEVIRLLDSLVRMFPAFCGNFVVDARPAYAPQILGVTEKGNEYVSRQEDLAGLLDQYPTHLKFTAQEEEEGSAQLEAMGVVPGSPFVCFHARDGKWFPTTRPSNVSVFGEWNRDDWRNASIQNYLPAAEKLVGLGYHTVRVGKFVAEPLTIGNPRIIDYSTKFQTDLMDLYLAAKCNFFIGQNSGMTGLPLIFRTPIAFVNVYPLRYINYCANVPNIFIPKHFHSDEKGRLLTLREQVSLGFAVLNAINDDSVTATIQRLGLRVLENTPEEIVEVATEMHQRLSSEFEESNETKELRNQFLKIIRSHPEAVYFLPSRYEHLKIASCFLKRHPELVS